MSGPAPATPAAVAAQLRALGVEPGGVLLVHASYRALRPIEGGPAGLLQALRDALGPVGTLVLPSWTGDDATPFDPAATPADRDLGVLADTFWRQPGVRRSAHPFAFAAAGPLASGIVDTPLPLPPHGPGSPVDQVLQCDGQVLLLGVGHDASTVLHLAEVMAGVPWGVPRHVTVLRDGRAERVDYLENDHCCARFALAGEWLREKGLEREGPVAHGTARVFRAIDAVGLALEALQRDPAVFLHAPGACDACDRARAGAPGVVRG